MAATISSAKETSIQETIRTTGKKIETKKEREKEEQRTSKLDIHMHKLIGTRKKERH